MTRVAIITGAWLAFFGANAMAQTLPTVPCATYATMADAQAGMLRELAKEVALQANGGLSVNEPEAQAAFERVSEAAKSAEAAIAALAHAWEDVQIETSKCRILAKRAGK